MELKKQNVILTFEKSKESIKLTLVTVNISCGCLFTLRMLSTVVYYPPWKSCWFFFMIPLGKFFCILFQGGTSLMYQAKKKKKKKRPDRARLGLAHVNWTAPRTQPRQLDTTSSATRYGKTRFFFCVFFILFYSVHL